MKRAFFIKSYLNNVHFANNVSKARKIQFPFQIWEIFFESLETTSFSFFAIVIGYKYVFE